MNDEMTSKGCYMLHKKISSGVDKDFQLHARKSSEVVSTVSKSVNVGGKVGPSQYSFQFISLASQNMGAQASRFNLSLQTWTEKHVLETIGYSLLRMVDGCQVVVMGVGQVRAQTGSAYVGGMYIRASSLR